MKQENGSHISTMDTEPDSKQDEDAASLLANDDDNSMTAGSVAVDQEFLNPEFQLLFPLCLVSFIDAISFMIVAPSLVFYVRDTLGGSKETYGMILSVFSLASFLFKPILGYGCDRFANFRMPYLISTAVAAIGGLLYFYASNTTSSNGIALLFWGRCLGGMGSANSTLGFTYIAKVIREHEMTKANAVLSMTKVIGMTLAPASFAILARVPDETVFGGWRVNSLNSVGLLLFVCNSLAWMVLYVSLQEPPDDRTKAVEAERLHNASVRSIDLVEQTHWQFIRSCLCFEILLFIFGILCLNSNFQLLETSLAPASNDALGWGPIQVSALFGANAVFLLLIIAWTFHLSSRGVSDFDLLLGGLAVSVVSYVLLYVWWYRGAAPWKFILPVMLSTGAFPFLGAPTRSLYTKVVAAKPRLRNHQGTMQAILSMSASVSGFMAPGLIAAFVLRTPEQVTASRYGRELTVGALVAPMASLIVLVGVVYLRQHPVFQVRQDGAIRSVVPADEGLLPAHTETTTLLEEDFTPLPHVFEPSTEASRRDSSIIMGIPQIDCFESPDQSVRKSM